MTDDPTILASAYLDDDLTADERARVEADPALLADVERLRQVRAVLGATEPAPLSMRERHLAAALDAWDRLPTTEHTSHDATPGGTDLAAAAGAASLTAPVSLDRRRRRNTRRSSALLATAAALVVVAGAGVVLRGALGGSDDDSSADSATSAEVDDAQSPLEVLEERAAEETFGEAADAELATEAAAEPVVADEAPSGGAAEAPPDADLDVLTSPDDVAVFAAAAVGAPLAVPSEEAEEVIGADAESESTEAAATPLCGLVDQLVGIALYQNGDVDETVVVGIDNEAGDAVAYRADDCTVIVRTALPDR